MTNDFAPYWASVGRYRHWKGWDRFETGEADRLAEKAYQTVRAYPLRKIPGPPKRKGKSTAEQVTRWLKGEGMAGY